MKEHVLKTDPRMFQASLKGIKKFEIRINDRNFKEGDVLELLETEHSGLDMEDGGLPLVYTGRVLFMKVDFVLHGHASGYGLAEDWVVMSVSAI